MTLNKPMSRSPSGAMQRRLLEQEQLRRSQLSVADARLTLLQARTNYAQAVADLLLADADVARALVGTSRDPR